MDVLSLFDGIRCGRVSLERAGIEVDNYYSSEIDKYAIQIADKNYPQDKCNRLGDVTKIDCSKLPKIDLLIGGSPCQGFSFAGKQLNFEDIRSKLFFEFVRILKETKPKYFLLENVVMKKEYKDVISSYLGVEPIKINSNLVSEQNRPRLYWTNINFNLGNIIKNKEKIDLNKKRVEIKLTPYAKEKYNLFIKEKGYIPKIFNPYNKKEIKDIYPCLTAQGNSQTKSSSVLLYNKNKYFMLDSIDWEILQTLPYNYTSGNKESIRKNTIGNGWTVDIIAHIFKGLR